MYGNPIRCKKPLDAGAQLLLNLNASPFHAGKGSNCGWKCCVSECAESGIPIVYVNLIGGQDELVFDGHSHGGEWRAAN
jgi:NAD+ synthase (glutamine-hydrolysing)